MTENTADFFRAPSPEPGLCNSLTVATRTHAHVNKIALQIAQTSNLHASETQWACSPTCLHGTHRPSTNTHTQAHTLAVITDFCGRLGPHDVSPARLRRQCFVFPGPHPDASAIYSSDSHTHGDTLTVYNKQRRAPTG